MSFNCCYQVRISGIKSWCDILLWYSALTFSETVMACNRIVSKPGLKHLLSVWFQNRNLEAAVSLRK